MMISGWGNYPRIEGRLAPFAREEAEQLVTGGASLIARGNGRAYGDAAINPRLTLDMRGWNRFLAFDDTTGYFRCQAGALLRDILDVFVPRGWFPAVTPGTSLVTIGGAIAADVHGKNHHAAGSFCDHVRSIVLLTADGRTVRCGPDEQPELFAMTRGGMGLTGVILEAEIRLIPIETAWIRQDTVPADNVAEAMEVFEGSSNWTYSVAWIDCLAKGKSLGRSLIYGGEHMRRDELPAEFRDHPLSPAARRKVSVPLDFPSWSLNRLSVSAFNHLYYARGRKRGPSVVDYDTYFYPLDSVLAWNRIYGSAGFVQYQCVLPLAASREGIEALLTLIASRGIGSFLAVLKLMGRQTGVMSFPMEGYTLALDMPLRSATLNLLHELDAVVADYGGRIYLAKDSRAGRGLMRRGYPKLDAFRGMRRDTGADQIFTSLQSERLDL